MRRTGVERAEKTEEIAVSAEIDDPKPGLDSADVATNCAIVVSETIARTIPESIDVTLVEQPARDELLARAAALATAIVALADGHVRVLAEELRRVLEDAQPRRADVVSLAARRLSGGVRG